MIKAVKTILLLIFIATGISACAGSSSPYGDPDGQRDRSKDAQDEMRRDTSRY